MELLYVVIPLLFLVLVYSAYTYMLLDKKLSHLETLFKQMVEKHDRTNQILEQSQAKEKEHRVLFSED